MRPGAEAYFGQQKAKVKAKLNEIILWLFSEVFDFSFFIFANSSWLLCVVCVCLLAGVGGVSARFKSNLLALLSPLATQQLFSHITYTQCVPYSLFTDLRVSLPHYTTIFYYIFFYSPLLCHLQSDFLFLSPRSQIVAHKFRQNQVLAQLY